MSADSRRPLLLLAAAVFFFHALVTGGHLMSPDEEIMYRTAESLAMKGTFAILPLEADMRTGLLMPGVQPDQTFLTKLGKNRDVFYAQYLPLQPVLTIPLVWLGKITEHVFAAPFARHTWPGMTTQYLSELPPDEYASAAWRRGVVVMLFNPLIAALSAIALARLARLLTGNRMAGIAAAALWAFGTVAWPHSRTYFTEPLAGLFALLAFDALCRWFLAPSISLKYAVMIGVWLALANLTRVDSPIFTVGVIGAMVALGVFRVVRHDTWAREGKSWPVVEIFVAGAIALAAWIALQSFNTMRFGHDITAGYGDQSEGVKFDTPLVIGIHGFLFSPGKGAFFFSPALLIGLWGWRRIPRNSRWVALAAIISFMPFFLAMSAWQNWAGGWCWGPRHIVQLHLPFMLGAAFLFAMPLSHIARIAVSTIAAIGVSVQVYGSSQSPLDYYREYYMTFRDLEYSRVNVDAFQAQMITNDFVFARRGDNGQSDGDVSPTQFPAPLQNSLYQPQDTQWAAYATMWKFGYCDWYLWNLFRSGKNPDRWSDAP
ncbi:hypothetical protein BH09SUM1_BH09SUM1_08810 [soil metagenome]